MTGAVKGRAPAVEPFLRGCAFPAAPGVPYPRMDPRDVARLPADTWQCAQIPAGVRLELVGDASAVEIDYATATDDLGYRGAGAGTTFALWSDGAPVDEQGASLGPGSVRLALGPTPGAHTVVYLPEGMRPEILALRPVGGAIEPAGARPRWAAYGDSILEGWVASAPALAWGAVAARAHGLDLLNMGFAGSARGEIPCAEALAGLDADVISITHGTNCWTRIAHSAGMFAEGTAAFLEIVRQGHPRTPVVVASPVLRPDAEATPNRLGATLADLRRAMEDVVEARVAAGDDRLALVRGGDVLGPAELGDGIHPNDIGHARLAEVLGSAVHGALRAAADEGA